MADKMALADLYADQGKYVKAEGLYVECLEKRQGKLGPDHPDTLSSMGRCQLRHTLSELVLLTAPVTQCLSLPGAAMTRCDKCPPEVCENSELNHTLGTTQPHTRDSSGQQLLHTFHPHQSISTNRGKQAAHASLSSLLLHTFHSRQLIHANRGKQSAHARCPDLRYL